MKKNNRNRVMLFLIGLFSLTQINIIGFIGISELVLYFIAPLLNQYQNLKLVCTGLPFNRKERLLLKKLRISGQVSAAFYSETELANLYVYARAFIYPSLYEGFGLPILEAFKAGCPVILAKSSCFPEVAGNAACYFDIDDADELRRHTKSMLSCVEQKEKYITLGLNRSAAFSWEQVAKQTTNVYRTCV